MKDVLRALEPSFLTLVELAQRIKELTSLRKKVWKAFKTGPVTDPPSLPAGELIPVPASPILLKSRHVVSSVLMNSNVHAALILGYVVKNVEFKICRHQFSLIANLPGPLSGMVPLLIYK